MNDIAFSYILDEYLKHIIIKRDEFKFDFEKEEKDYRKTNMELNKFLDKSTRRIGNY